jgi:hypothetical protein
VARTAQGVANELAVSALSWNGEMNLARLCIKATSCVPRCSSDSDAEASCRRLRTGRAAPERLSSALLDRIGTEASRRAQCVTPRLRSDRHCRFATAAATPDMGGAEQGTSQKAPKRKGTGLFRARALISRRNQTTADP